jgi:tight adherence protein C
MNATFVILGLAVFAIIGAFFYGAFILLNPTRTAQDRLREMQAGKEAEVYDIITVEGTETQTNSLASRLGALAQPSSEEDRNKQRQLLVQAGYKSRHSLEIFNGLRVSAAIVLPMIAVPLGMASGSLLQTAAIVLFAAAAGYYVPALIVRNLSDKRKRKLVKAFPDALDLLVSCVEAGLGLDAAFRRVALELDTAAPELSKEFQLVTHEISAGVPRAEALRHLERRTGLDELRSLVNMLVQAERFGTSIAKGLRIHSKMTRQKRMSKAEEEAAKVSPKLTVVMILFLLPVLAVILVGPAGIRVYEIMHK